MKRREMLIGLGITPFLAPILVGSAGAAQESKDAKTKDQDAKKNDQEETMSVLYVQTADAVTLKNNKLTMGGIAGATIFFSDRPQRVVGHVPTKIFLDDWSEGNDSFKDIPPNATISVLEGEKLEEIVVELSNPMLKGDTLTYDVRVLEGSKSAKGKACSLFIDDVVVVNQVVVAPAYGVLSYRGGARRVARRTSRRVVRRR